MKVSRHHSDRHSLAERNEVVARALGEFVEHRDSREERFKFREQIFDCRNINFKFFSSVEVKFFDFLNIDLSVHGNVRRIKKMVCSVAHRAQNDDGFLRFIRLNNRSNIADSLRVGNRTATEFHYYHNEDILMN